MKRDNDKLEGIPAFPNVAAWRGWRRAVYRSTAAAAGTPQNATDMLLSAESWKGEPEKSAEAAVDEARRDARERAQEVPCEGSQPPETGVHCRG